MTFLENLFSVSGKTALVTGGATGIGKMVAIALYQAGAHVMIASRKGDDCARVAEEINGLGGVGKVEGFMGDVSSEEGILALVDSVNKRTDALHILINNAGVSWGAGYDEFPHKAWEKVFSVNVAAIFTLTQKLTPLLKSSSTKQDPARIINVGSVMGSQPIADGAYSYSASKAAVHHLTKILADELSSSHITVNAFAPGPFQSKMTAFATVGEGRAEKVGEGVPLGRIGNGDDLAGATLYLCGKAGAYITGAILPLDGGLSVQHGIRLFKD